MNSNLKLRLEYIPPRGGLPMVLATIADPGLTQKAVRHAIAAAERRAQLAATGKDSIVAYAESLEAARLAELMNVILA